MKDAQDLSREAFENAVFNRRFRASIKRNPSPPRGFGGLDFISTDCPTQAELCKRDEQGDYAEDTVSAMWWGWQTALQAGVAAPVAQEPAEPSMQWVGDVMILQVLADSEHVNEQEREVLTRWIASQPAGALLQQALGALEYHQEQTRPIERTKDAITALRAHLATHKEKS